jgi:hypothetical protein
MQNRKVLRQGDAQYGAKKSRGRYQPRLSRQMTCVIRRDRFNLLVFASS